jgi:hypothetical protein
LAKGSKEVRGMLRVLWISLLLTGMWTGILSGNPVNVSINTSAVAGSTLNLAIDFTTSSPGAVTFCSPSCLTVTDFSAPGSTMGLPTTTGGLVQGDLILVENPAPFTEIEKGSGFNEVIVNLSPVKNLITFTLSFSDTGPVSGLPPDEISVFALDSSLLPLFPTSDPTGSDALFAIDLTGAPGGVVSAFAPTTQNQDSLSITVPGQVSTVPEPVEAGLVGLSVMILFAFSRDIKRRIGKQRGGATRSPSP